MPRMKGAAMQCCMCLTGVFMFLGGVIMLATGITLILNYGFFDEELLPPDLQNEQGKRTVGIILTCCGLLAIVISVIVSVMYFCFKSKSPSINPDDLSRIPTTARNTPDMHARRGDRRVHNSSKVSNGATRSQSHHPAKPIPGSTEVKLPRQYKKGRHKHRPRHVRRLEEIKEQDAVSRKIDEDYADTPRSGSFSSEMTLDDHNKTVPKVVLSDHDQNRPPSECSMSTSITSDTSNLRYLDNDKSRRELQFKPDSNRGETASKDSTSLEHYDETVSPYDAKNSDRFSETSDILRYPPINSNNSSRDSDMGHSAGGVQSRDKFEEDNKTYGMAIGNSDELVVRYQASNYTEQDGETSSWSQDTSGSNKMTVVEPVDPNSEYS